MLMLRKSQPNLPPSRSVWRTLPTTTRPSASLQNATIKTSSPGICTTEVATLPLRRHLTCLLTTLGPFLSNCVSGEWLEPHEKICSLDHARNYSLERVHHNRR